MSIRAGACAMAVIMLLLSGCAGTVKSYRYYTLKPLVESKEQFFKGSTGISPIIIPEWMDQQSLVWSDGHFRLFRADIDRWGEPLASAITRVTTENLNALAGGSPVSRGPWLKSQKPERTVDIELLSLAQNEHQVVLDVRWSIAEKGATGLSYRLQFSRTNTDYKKPEKLAECFSQLLSDMAFAIGRQLGS